MIFWRIEDNEGLGPYRGKRNLESRPLLKQIDSPRWHAMLRTRSFNERRLDRMFKRGWKSAWSSYDLLIDHCNGNLEKLEGMGFHVVQVKARRWRLFPDGQVIYLE